VDVPIKTFTAGNWVHDAWGMLPFVYPGAAKKDNLKAAIQLYSRLQGDIPRRTVYRFTGWKKIGDAWHYLTGSGSVAAAGLGDSVQVELDAGHMQRYRLPPPLSADTLKQALDEALLLLEVCPNKRHVGAVLLAAVARAPLGECHPTDSAIWLHGLTGSRKSALAAVALAFFGEFHGRSFPANWNDSPLDIDIKTHQAKDAVFVLDDFKPSVSPGLANELHAKAERVVRNTGNQAGAGRRNIDHSAKPVRFNRSMLISTAEDLPRGQSLLGRLLVLELTRDDVDNAVLSKLQDAASAERLAGLMAGYVQWLAGRLDDLKRDFPRIVEQLRDGAIRGGFCSSHPRAPEIYANLVGAAELFLDFLIDAGALSSERANNLLSDMETALKQAFSEQGAYQAEEDETERFMQLLRAVLSSGNGHIADRLEQGPPSIRPFGWGWRKSPNDVGQQYEPMGDCLGWYYASKDGGADEVWLEPATAYKAVQHFGRIQGDVILLKPATLWRRMAERGLIKQVSEEQGRVRISVKQRVGGRDVRVLILDAKMVESET